MGRLIQVDIYIPRRLYGRCNIASPPVTDIVWYNAKDSATSGVVTTWRRRTGGGRIWDKYVSLKITLAGYAGRLMKSVAIKTHVATSRAARYSGVDELAIYR